MEQKVQQQIIDYFTHLDQVYKTVKLKLVDCQRAAVKIYHLMERMKRLKKADLNQTPLEQHEGLIEKISFYNINAINVSMLVLQTVSQEFDKLQESLSKKKIALEKSCCSISFSLPSPLIDGSAFQPRLSDLLEFSLDGVAIISGICSQIQNAMLNFTSKDYSAAQYNEAFIFDKISKERLEEIILLTQFCNKNEIST